jgi:hypothetical protein
MFILSPFVLIIVIKLFGRSQWARGLRRRSAAARLLRLWVRISPGAWIFVWYDCCVLSGRGLCDELITRREESYRLRCVVVCDLETSWMRRPWPTGRGGEAVAPKNKQIKYLTDKEFTSSFNPPFYYYHHSVRSKYSPLNLVLKHETPFFPYEWTAS